MAISARNSILTALLFTSTIAGGGFASAQETAWPTAAQRELAAQRLATFPRDALVNDVDWYQPQEPVAGSNAAPFELASRPSIPTEALSAAQTLIETKDSYAFLVWRNGQLEHEYYASGFDSKSRFATASMAKTVVGLAVGSAVDQGIIKSIDDPVERYIPAVAGTARGALPIRNYLEMSSGFETPSASGPDAQVYWQYALGDNIGEAVARWPETCEAGREFCYANANTAMLGWAIEGASGKRYADWLSENIWQPIGAADGRLWVDRPGGWPRYSCCLHANAQDWLRIGLVILNNGQVGDTQVVSKSWIEQMLAPSPANPNYGFQIWRGSPHNPERSYGKAVNVKVPAKAPFARDDVYYLDGSAGQRVYVIPSEQMVVVRIGAPRIDWDDSELPNILLDAL